MKRIFSFLMIAAIVSLAIVSCKDDFNEEDFLALQHQQKLEHDSIEWARRNADLDSTKKESVQSYINALNEAGDLMSLTILIRDNDVPVEGATVRLFTGTPESVQGGRAKEEQMGTTNAQGNVTFDRVTIGQSTISISKNGYTSATALADICCVLPPKEINVNVDGAQYTYYTVPEKQFRNLSLPIFSNTGAATATITGKVTIETDVTNRTPEIPQNLTIRGNFNNLVATPVGTTLVVTQYSFEDSNFGTATVNNTTGEYSMVVPATVNPYNVTMIMPTFETNQRVAIAFVDNVALPAGPEYRNQPTTFGPNAGTYTVVPAIFGAKAVFAAPPAPGRGFSISTPTPVGRGLPLAAISTSNLSTPAGSNVTFNFSSRGRGFSSSPTVLISNGGGTGATAAAALSGFIASASITSTGTAFPVSSNFDVLFTFTDAAGVTQVLNGVRATVSSDAVGNISPQTIVLPNAMGYRSDNRYLTPNGIQGFGVRLVTTGLGPAATPAGANQPTFSFTNDNEIASVTILQAGSGYTSAPTITFNGGGTPSSSPAMSIAAFRTQFDFTLNSTNTTPYRVLPSEFIFTFPANNVDGMFVQNSAQIDRVTGEIGGGITGDDFIEHVTTDGTNILALNPSQGFRTSTFSVFPPVLTVVDRPNTPAAAVLNVSPTTGQIISLENPNSGLLAVDNVGSGYDSYNSFSIMPSAPTAPGSGAAVALTLSSNPSSKVVTWGGFSTLVAGGSGYLDELNQLRVPFGGGISARTASVLVAVSAGQTSVFNYNYGSGVPKTNIMGNFR